MGNSTKEQEAKEAEAKKAKEAKEAEAKKAKEAKEAEKPEKSEGRKQIKVSKGEKYAGKEVLERYEEDGGKFVVLESGETIKEQTKK